MLRPLKRYFTVHGLNVFTFAKSLLYWSRFIRDIRKYNEFEDQRFPLRCGDLYPILNEYNDQAGVLKGHYVHQDLWAARKIYKAAPKRHVDVASRIDGFITSLMAFRDVEVIDVRPLTSPYKELKFVQDDATEMQQFKDSELESVSCLHAIEHFGLGRYGDPIDPDAVEKFAQSLARVIKPGGTLYLSTPIGQQRLEFNAHRVFDPLYILELFADFELASFSAVNDEGDFVEHTQPDAHKNVRFSCGLYEFRKKKS